MILPDVNILVQLVLREENVKVTISLNKSSVEFFKKEA